jgi:hypothetical protein
MHTGTLRKSIDLALGVVKELDVNLRILGAGPKVHNRHYILKGIFPFSEKVAFGPKDPLDFWLFVTKANTCSL